MRSRKKKKKMLFSSVISRTFQTLYLSIYSPSPQVRTAHKGGTSIVEKGPRAKFLLSFIEVGVDQFTEKKKKLFVTPHKHNSSTRPVVHALSAPGALASLTHWVPWQLFPRQQLKSWIMMMMTQQEELTNSSRMKNELNLSTFDLPVLRLYKHVNPMTLLCACLNVASEIWSNKLLWKHRTAVNVVTLHAQHTNNRQFKNVKCIFQSREAWNDPELVNMWNHPIAACFYCSFRAGLIQHLGGADL